MLRYNWLFFVLFWLVIRSTINFRRIYFFFVRFVIRLRVSNRRVYLYFSLHFIGSPLDFMFRRFSNNLSFWRGPWREISIFHLRGRRREYLALLFSWSHLKLLYEFSHKFKMLFRLPGIVFVIPPLPFNLVFDFARYGTQSLTTDGLNNVKVFIYIFLSTWHIIWITLMKNIIEYLWQVDHPIVFQADNQTGIVCVQSSFVRVSTEESHWYFYSQKQSKTLRKKK
jgi:hypothetical protein